MDSALAADVLENVLGLINTCLDGTGDKWQNDQQLTLEEIQPKLEQLLTDIKNGG